jgi:carbon-monoxide dehydrogenase medium subunit
MSYWKNYLQPKTIEEAVQALAGATGPVRLVAGGTDLLLDLQQGRTPPVETLVDISAIPDLASLETRGAELFIGAGVPLSRVAAAPLVRQHAQALHEAASLIGGPQVRNAGTLGGNVAHALPAADGSIALHALGAEVETAGPGGRRRTPIASLYLGPGRSTLAADELLVGFYLPLGQAGQGSAFRRVMRPQGVALPVLNLAVWVAQSRAGGRETIAAVQIAIGPAGPTPQRATAAEAALRGQAPEAGLAAAQAALRSLPFRTSPQRATAEYRRHLAGILLAETLAAAWERAGQTWN